MARSPLRWLRELRGLSQRALAARLGKTQATVARSEVSDPRLSTLCAVGEAVGMDLVLVARDGDTEHTFDLPAGEREENAE